MSYRTFPDPKHSFSFTSCIEIGAKPHEGVVTFNVYKDRNHSDYIFVFGDGDRLCSISFNSLVAAMQHFKDNYQKGC